MPSFTIAGPAANGIAHIIAGAVVITINDTSGGTESYRAKLFSYTPGMGSGDQIGTTVSLVAIPGTSQFRASLPDTSIMSAPPAGNNREVLVDQLSDSSGLTWAFKLGLPGSGSIQEEVVLTRLCAEGQPVPVSLKLKLDSALAKGTCTNIRELNKPVILVHPSEPRHGAKWFSPPINLGQKGSEPAYWVLEKADVRTWLLVLLRDKTVIVTYRLKTKIPRDCRLPIRLEREGAGGKHFKKWPKSATISPAP